MQTAVVVAMSLLAGGVARAQETTGRLTGRVTDKDTGLPLGGVTVIVQGPQGEDATLTDDRGEYHFTSLPVGTYMIRFYVANASAQVEQRGVTIAADKMVRVNAKIAGTAQAAAQQKYVITGQSAEHRHRQRPRRRRVRRDFWPEHPARTRTYGDAIVRAPRAPSSIPSGNVSIAGVDRPREHLHRQRPQRHGHRVRQPRGGHAVDRRRHQPAAGVPAADRRQRRRLPGRTTAARWAASSTACSSPAATSSTAACSATGPRTGCRAARTRSPPSGRSLGYVRKPDFDTSIGAEVGGPIIKDRLFFWAGFAPRFDDTHVFRQTYCALQPGDDGRRDRRERRPDPDRELTSWRARIPESRQTYYFAATVDFIPRPEHRLTVAASGRPNFNEQMRSFNGLEFISNPSWAQESLTKTNTDFTASGRRSCSTTSGRSTRWPACTPSTTTTVRPTGRSTTSNQLEYWGANLWDLERAPGLRTDHESRRVRSFSPARSTTTTPAASA